MSDFLVTVLPYLDSTSLDLKAKALDILISSISSESLVSSLLDDATGLQKVANCLEDPFLSVSATKILINVAAEHVAILRMVDVVKLIHDLLKVARKEVQNINFYTVLLANLTSDESNANIFLEALDRCETNSDEIFLFKKFFEYEPKSEDIHDLIFANAASNESAYSIVEKDSSDLETSDTASSPWDVLDVYQYVSSILCNISRVERGRAFILSRTNNYATRLFPQIQSANPVRRRGAVATLRNLLFDSELHLWLVLDANILTPLLLPLLVHTPFSPQETEGMDVVLLQAQTAHKVSESDVSIRKMLLESIVLLCQRRVIRDELRRRKVYPIVRNLDYLVEDDVVSELVYELVNLLMRDEDANTSAMTYA